MAWESLVKRQRPGLLTGESRSIALQHSLTWEPNVEAEATLDSALQPWRLAEREHNIPFGGNYILSCRVRIRSEHDTCSLCIWR